MTKIENFKYGVDEAFKNCFYIVPDYQREYVWEEKNVNQLLEDIYDEYQGNSENSEYFIGTIIVAKEGNLFEVIDGQQRITTLFLIFAVLRELLKDKPEYIEKMNRLMADSYTGNKGELIRRCKIVLKYENAEKFINDLVNKENNLKNTNKGIEIDNQKGSLLRLSLAFNYILNFFRNNFNNSEEIIKFFGFLSNKVKFIQIETNIHGALKVFETINDRGVGLNPMDLLKNLLFRNVSKEEFDRLRKEWGKITTKLDNNKQKPLRFLRYFLMANYNIKNKKGEPIIREDEIYDWITDKNNAKEIEYETRPFDFVQKLQTNANAYINFSQGKYIDGTSMNYLENIRYLSGSFSQHLILLLAAKNLSKDNFTYFCKQIESLIFYYIITRTPTREFERIFSRWADEIKKFTLNNSYLQKKELNDFILEKFKPELELKEQNYQYHFMDLNYNSLQQYRIRYILAKIEQYLKSQWYGYESTISLNEIVKGNIEHILPNNPSEELFENFRLENPNVKYEDYKIKLGNLTLLEKPINVVAGRNFYKEKTELYKKSSYLITKTIARLEEVGKNTTINKMNQELKTFDIWNNESIDERQDMLFNISKKIWKIDQN
jgi:uncharacterized protein with ParB-like and HNH nuclease domain